MAIDACSCIWFVSMLLICCVLVEATSDILLSINSCFIIFGLDSSNQKACLLGQFTYSTSILPCLACTVLQECVSPFEFTSIKLPTLNIFGVINGQIRNLGINLQSMPNSEGIV